MWASLVALANASGRLEVTVDVGAAELRMLEVTPPAEMSEGSAVGAEVGDGVPTR